jgi:hypothetical protein
VLESACRQLGRPQEALDGEYFSVSDAPDYVNEAFVLKLARSVTRLEEPSYLVRAVEARYGFDAAPGKARGQRGF